MGLSVTEAWNRIMTWCATYAPETDFRMRGPASERDRRATEKATGTSWPGDLHEWYGLCDGPASLGGPAVYDVLPGYHQLRLKMLVSTWRSWQHIMVDFYRPDEIRERRAEDAGTMAHAFLPDFVPIAANGGGNYLFVDTRPGDRSGCVTEYAHGDADSRGPIWPSTAAMLTDVAHALEHGVASYDRVPVVEQRGLTWWAEGRR